MTGICMSIRITSNGSASIRCGQGQVDRLRPFSATVDLGASLLKHEGDEPLVVRPVFGQQDAATVRQLARVGESLRFRAGAGGYTSGGRRAAGRPSSGPVGTVTLKVLPLPGCSGQPISPPSSSASRLLMVRPRPVPPNCGVVEASAWVKGRKKRCHGLLGHADARVDDVELQHRSRSGRRQEARDQPHAADFGELDGVAHQVDQDLPQAGRDRSGSSPGMRPSNSTCRVNPLAAGRTRISETTSATIRQGEQRVCSIASFPASIFERSRMSSMSEQVFAVPANDFEGIADSCVARSGHCLAHPSDEQFHVAEDGGHGRADFVAHVGQELALGTVGRFRRLSRLRPRFFGKSSFCDVAGDTHHARRTGVASSHKRYVDFGPFSGAVLAAIFDFQPHGIDPYTWWFHGLR